MTCIYCDSPVLSRNMCSAHYTRWKRHKDVPPNEKPLTLKNRELTSLGLHNHHPFYQAWVNMKTRCDNNKSTQYYWYGLRGIHYCEEWKEFRNFHKDMWSFWAEGLKLERNNNDGNYDKYNCSWTTAGQQANNRRKRGTA